MMMAHGLQGCRVLVVEDETLIAVMIEEVLHDLGCVVVGPVGKLSAALRLATEETLDAAILDISIRGGMVYPVAEVLLNRHVPFVFASGYGDWVLPDVFGDQPRLTKPFSMRELEEMVTLMIHPPVAAACGPGASAVV